MTNAGPNGDIDSIFLARHAIGGQETSMAKGSDNRVRSVTIVAQFYERKSVSRQSIAISLYLAGHISSLLVLLDTGSSSMSTFQNTEYMDARGSAFNNVGRDQINAQVIINPNSLGAMQNHSLLYHYKLILCDT